MPPGEGTPSVLGCAISRGKRGRFFLANIPLANPSGVTVQDRLSLIQNFAENSRKVLCQATFGAGAYAIGGRLLGFKPVPPQAALVTGAALLAGLALCPSGADPNDIVGTPPSFQGGQCSVLYDVTAELTAPNGSTQQALARVLGPVKGLEFVNPPLVSISGLYVVGGLPGNPQGKSYGILSSGSPAQIPSSRILSVVRVDGQPDNCGSLPNTGGQIITNVNSGDTIDNSTVNNNSENNYIAPVFFNVGGVSGSLNLSFGDIKIGSLLPLNFSINISGTRFKFEENPDGDLEPKPVNPDPGTPETGEEQLQELLDKLEEIRVCVCESSPPVELVTAAIPFVTDDSPGCEPQTFPLEVLSSSYTPDKAGKLINSAVLASLGCEALSGPEQLPEQLIFAATTLSDGRELFTGPITPEVCSLRLQITSFDPNLLNRINLYPAANQFKFGSVAFTALNSDGGGDYIYVFDSNTYIPLPSRGKNGRLRVLFKAGISFEVFDTGERL